MLTISICISIDIYTCVCVRVRTETILLVALLILYEEALLQMDVADVMAFLHDIPKVTNKMYIYSWYCISISMQSSSSSSSSSRMYFTMMMCRPVFH
jgi:hypothetical protein